MIRKLLTGGLGSAAALLAVPVIAAASTGWVIVPSDNSSPTLDNTLQGMSCVATFDCWSVGYRGTASGHSSTTQTLIEHRTGSGWVIVNSPNTGASDNNALIAVTCVSSSDCWAVGFGGATQSTLAEHWNGSAWSIVATPNPMIGNSTAASQLYSVACVTTSDCWAVGEYINANGYYDALFEHWNGSAWSIATAPANATGGDNLLFGVACTASDNCFAVGYECSSGAQSGNCLNTAGPQQSYWDRWDGTSWSNYSNGAESTDNALDGITCTAAECWAVGYEGNNALLEHWDSTIGFTVTQKSSSSGSAVLYGVACDAAQHCSAVGFQGSSPAQTLALEHSGDYTNAWTVAPSENTNSDNILYGVGCDSTDNCAAAGYYSGDSAFQTLVEENAQPAANVPEAPAGLLIPLAGVGAIGVSSLVRRRRRGAAA